jgi:uncharacterized protein (DUF736 family)
MIIGNFSYDPGSDVYRGEIITLTLQRYVEFHPNEKTSDKEPDYRVIQVRDGAVFELGAAWKRSSERGRDYLSIMLDDPALPSSLNAALFPSADDQDQAALVWQRQNRKAPAAEPNPPAAESKPANARPRRLAAVRSPAPA